MPEKLRRQYVRAVSMLFHPVLSGKRSFWKIRAKLLQARTHSPIQDLKQVLFNNTRFKEHVMRKFNLKKLDLPEDFYALPERLRKEIAVERLKYTMLPPLRKQKTLDYFVQKCENNEELAEPVKSYFVEKHRWVR